jgi:hypothetical protein
VHKYKPVYDANNTGCTAGWGRVRYPGNSRLRVPRERARLRPDAPARRKRGVCVEGADTGRMPAYVQGLGREIWVWFPCECAARHPLITYMSGCCFVHSAFRLTVMASTKSFCCFLCNGQTKLRPSLAVSRLDCGSDPITQVQHHHWHAAVWPGNSDAEGPFQGLRRAWCVLDVMAHWPL